VSGLNCEYVRARVSGVTDILITRRCTLEGWSRSWTSYQHATNFSCFETSNRDCVESL